MNITEFLLARIAEDESVARRVAEGPGEAGSQGMWSVQIGVSGNNAQFAHVASDPARVLAECAAKRAIIEAHGLEGGYADDYCETCADWWRSELGEGPPPVKWPCPTLRALAAVFNDHPDYRQDWTVAAS